MRPWRHSGTTVVVRTKFGAYVWDEPRATLEYFANEHNRPSWSVHLGTALYNNTLRDATLAAANREYNRLLNS